jgi:DNA-binding NtrC family response regulator
VASTGEEGLQRIRENPPDVILLDMRLPDGSGLEIYKEIRALDARIPVIFVTIVRAADSAIEAMQQGAYDYLFKPLNLQELQRVVSEALNVAQRMHEPAVVTETPPEPDVEGAIIGICPAMREVYKAIGRIASQNVPVLITGESGTGKELVARALHFASLRGDRGFVEVNCAAIPEELIESELFGHVTGSFTGATENKVGKFAKADGGTLFLDEVADMSLRTQAKVLRVLEEQRLEPVGSNQTVTVDVRVIAATNKTLEEEIAHGRFREDLFYRLNVIPFTLPPLRERIEDVPVLARYFMLEFAAAYGRKPKEVSEAALGVMARYHWPGNVRELRNLIERLMIVVPQDKIEPLHLPPELFRASSRMAQQPNATLHEARSAYEREFILRKLEENQWHMTRTAEALGLERSHLYRRMRALGIKTEE